MRSAATAQIYDVVRLLLAILRPVLLYLYLRAFSEYRDPSERLQSLYVKLHVAYNACPGSARQHRGVPAPQVECVIAELPILRGRFDTFRRQVLRSPALEGACHGFRVLSRYLQVV